MKIDTKTFGFSSDNNDIGNKKTPSFYICLFNRKIVNPPWRIKVNFYEPTRFLFKYYSIIGLGAQNTHNSATFQNIQWKIRKILTII